MTNLNINENELIKIFQNKSFNEIKGFFSNNKILKNNLKYYKEILFYLIEKNETYNIIEYIFFQQQTIYRNQNIDNTDLLYYSIEYGNFKVAKLLLKNGVQINNKNNNIIEYLFKKNKLSIEKLYFILKIVKDASLCTIEVLYQIIEKERWDLYKEIMTFNYYDVSFIINLILLSKKNISFSNKELNNYFYNNNNAIIKINDQLNNTDYLSVALGRYIDSIFIDVIEIFFKYANDNNIIIDINNQYNKFNVSLIYNSLSGNSYKKFKIIEEYASKNKIILDLNMCYPETIIYKAIVLDYNKEFINYLINYAETNNIIINFNIIRFYNKIFRCIINEKKPDMLEIIINYSIKHNLTIKYSIIDLECLKESNNQKLLYLFDKYNNLFECFGRL